MTFSNCTIAQTLTYCFWYFNQTVLLRPQRTENHENPFSDISCSGQSEQLSQLSFSWSDANQLNEYGAKCLISEEISWTLIWEIFRSRWATKHGMRLLFAMAIPLGLISLASNVYSLILYTCRLRDSKLYGHQISLTLIDVFALIFTGMYGVHGVFLVLWQYRTFCFHPLIMRAAAYLENWMWGTVASANFLLTLLCFDHYYAMEVPTAAGIGSTAAAMVVGSPRTAAGGGIHWVFHEQYYYARVILINAIVYIVGYGLSLSMMARKVLFRGGSQVYRHEMFCMLLWHHEHRSDSSNSFDHEYYSETTVGGYQEARMQRFERFMVRTGYGQLKRFYTRTIGDSKGPGRCLYGESDPLFTVIFLGILLASYVALVIASVLLYRKTRRMDATVVSASSTAPTSSSNRSADSRPHSKTCWGANEVSETEFAGSSRQNLSHSPTEPSVRPGEAPTKIGCSDKVQRCPQNSNNNSPPKAGCGGGESGGGPAECPEMYRKFANAVAMVLMAESMLALFQVLTTLSSIAFDLLPRDFKRQNEAFGGLQFVIEALSVICYLIQCSVNAVFLTNPKTRYLSAREEAKKFLFKFPPWNRI